MVDSVPSTGQNGDVKNNAATEEGQRREKVSNLRSAEKEPLQAAVVMPPYRQPSPTSNQEVNVSTQEGVNERGEGAHEFKKEVKFIETDKSEVDVSSGNLIQSVEKVLKFADDHHDDKTKGTNGIEQSKISTKKKTSKQPKNSKSSQKKMKKGIFISYSPDGGYYERKFVADTVKQFKENNLAEDIWFDKDEKNTDSPAWFSQRMEVVERCRAAVVFLSASYFQCPVSVYEARCLVERQSGEKPPKILAVLLLDSVDIPHKYSDLILNNICLTGSYSSLSLAEKSSLVIGKFIEDLEKYASVFAPSTSLTPELDYTEEYKHKKLCRWSSNDVQSWLYYMGIREFFQQSFAEQAVDGFLLMSLMESDLTEYLAIDSRVVRKKILQQIFLILEKEHRLSENWHLRLRTLRCRADAVYLVYDPADVRLARNLKQDLQRKSLQVLTHDKLGQSKEEFLQINGPLMAQAKNIVVLLTEASISSPFVFQEVLFADWLGKTLVTAMLKNVWGKMRPSLKAVLGEYPAIDFETKMYSDGMDILQHHIKPLRKVPGVVLAQSYLNRISEGLKPLQILAASTNTGWSLADLPQPKVFISYQWDMQSKVQEIKRILEANGMPCWSDIAPTITRGNSSISSRSSTTASTASSESLQSHIQRNMKAASIVLCCVTPRYLQSDNCVKDLVLADQLQKHIIPVLLRFISWPPDTGPSQIKKILSRTSHVDLSNDKLYKQNFHLLLDRVRRQLAQKT